MDYTKVIKMVENGLVIIVLMLVIIILTKPVTQIIENAHMESAKENTRVIFNASKDYYSSITLLNSVELPFRIVFDDKIDKGYKVYSNEKEFASDIYELRVNGKLPSSGSVEINAQGNVACINLKIGKFICNKASISSREVCVKE